MTIKGSGMVHPTAVRFGSLPATSVTANATGTAVTAVAPAQAAGTVDVTVTTSGGTSITSSADLYTYLAPSITRVSPASGPGAGGNKVTITGVALNKATTVMFGSVPATHFTVNSLGTAITAIAPSEAAGTVDVTVTSRSRRAPPSPRWSRRARRARWQ